MGRRDGTSRFAKVSTVPTTSSDICPPDVASSQLTILIASFLCLSLHTLKSVSSLASMPYSAQLARVACSKPASLKMSDFHVCWASMATALFLGAPLSVLVSANGALGFRIRPRSWTTCIDSTYTIGIAHSALEFQVWVKPWKDLSDHHPGRSSALALVFHPCCFSCLGHLP